MIHVKTTEIPEEDFPHVVHKARKMWCVDTFGRPFQNLSETRKWTDMRWCQYDTYFRFKYEKDAMLFILRWGGEIRNKAKWEIAE